MRITTTIITVACGTVSAIALQKSVLNLAMTPDSPPPPKPNGTKDNRALAPKPTTPIATPEKVLATQRVAGASKISSSSAQTQPKAQSAKGAIDAELAQVDTKIAKVSPALIPGLRPLPSVKVSQTISAVAPSTQRTEIATPETTSTSQSRRHPSDLLSMQTVPLGDMQGHWAQNAVEALASKGIVQGFTDGSFRPDQPVTAVEFAAMSQKAFRESPISYRDLQAQISDRAITRADAAAFIYQTLARTEQSPTNTTIQVIGQVARPGAYTLGAANIKLNQESIPTVTQAIQQAGGARSTANLRQVQIHRAVSTGAKRIIDVNVWQMLQAGDLTQDVVLQQDDKVVVPSATAVNQPPTHPRTKTVRVNVLGAVDKPGPVELLANTPIDQLLQEVGTIRQGSQRTVQLIRFNPNGTISQQIMALNVTGEYAALHNNDILVVRHPGTVETPILSKPMMDLLSRVLPSSLS